MDLSTITMEKPKARQAFLDYRKAVREGGGAEDEQIMRGYRELARGRQLISLPEVIAAGGVDDQGLPRLAVMRADVPSCWVRRDYPGSVSFSCVRWPDGRRKKGIYRLPAGTLPSVDERKSWPWWYEMRAMVPPIPPALRPPHRLANYEILWEATWEKVPRPPGDPALLRHIGGDLYAVLAIWDLTDLERAVLAGRSANP